VAGSGIGGRYASGIGTGRASELDPARAGGILATASFFAKDTLALLSKIPYQISLKNFRDLTWCLKAALGRGVT
jgi:hypothetical protein